MEERSFFAYLNENVEGPFTLDELRKRWNAGEISGDCLVSVSGHGEPEWCSLAEVVGTGRKHQLKLRKDGKPSDAPAISSGEPPLTSEQKAYLIRHRIGESELRSRLTERQASGIIRRHRFRARIRSYTGVFFCAAAILGALVAGSEYLVYKEARRSLPPLDPIPERPPEPKKETYGILPNELTSWLKSDAKVVVLESSDRQLHNLLAEQKNLLQSLIVGSEVSGPDFESRRLSLLGDFPQAKGSSSYSGGQSSSGRRAYAYSTDSRSVAGVSGSSSAGRSQVVGVRVNVVESYKNLFSHLRRETLQDQLESIRGRLERDIASRRKAQEQAISQTYATTENSLTLTWLRASLLPYLERWERFEETYRKENDPMRFHQKWEAFEKDKLPTIPVLISALRPTYVPLSADLTFEVPAPAKIFLVHATIGSRELFLSAGEDDGHSFQIFKVLK